MVRTITLLALLCFLFSCDTDNSSMYETPSPITKVEFGSDSEEFEIEREEEISWADQASGEITGSNGFTYDFVLQDINSNADFSNVSNSFTVGSSAALLSANNSDLVKQEPKQKTKSKPKPNAKIIWTGGLEFQVNNVDSATTIISDIAALNEGFVSEMNKTQSNTRIKNSITLKVNSENFQKTINELKKLSIHLNQETINSQDVSKEYIDAESRLKTKQEVLERYKDILRTRTGKIEEVLDAEEKIRRLTEEIEAKKGYLRYLNDRVKYSRIQLSIYETVEFISEEPVRYEKTFGDKAIAGFGNGWSIIQNIVLVLITLWPVLLIVGTLLFWKRKWIKKTFSK